MSISVNRGSGSSGKIQPGGKYAEDRVTWARRAFRRADEGYADLDTFPDSDFETAAEAYMRAIKEHLESIEPKSGVKYANMFTNEKCYNAIFTSDYNIDNGGGYTARKTLDEVKDHMKAWCTDHNKRYYYVPFHTEAHYAHTNALWDQDRYPFFTTNTWLKVAVNPTMAVEKWNIIEIEFAIVHDAWTRHFHMPQNKWPISRGWK